MIHQATLAYNETLIRRSSFAFVWHTCGLPFVAGVPLLAFGIVWLVALGDRSWQIGSLATTLIFASAIVATVYFSQYRNALTKLRCMDTPLAGLVVEDATFSITTGTGRNTLRWATITKVWRFPGFWLLFFSKAQFFTVPIASLSPEMQAFILVRVKAAGGKVMEKATSRMAKAHPPG